MAVAKETVIVVEPKYALLPNWKENMAGPKCGHIKDPAKIQAKVAEWKAGATEKALESSVTTCIESCAYQIVAPNKEPTIYGPGTISDALLPKGPILVIAWDASRFLRNLFTSGLYKQMYLGEDGFYHQRFRHLSIRSIVVAGETSVVDDEYCYRNRLGIGSTDDVTERGLKQSVERMVEFLGL